MSNNEHDYDYDDGPHGCVICPRCDGGMTVACHCGGDLCFCDNEGERDCPLCGGEFGDEGYVKKEVADECMKRQAEFHAFMATAITKDTEAND